MTEPAPTRPNAPVNATADASADGWLTRWLPQIKAHTGTRPILELGCGSGDDTAVLAAAGYPVVALDRSPEAIADARAKCAATFLCRDLREPFPCNEVGVLVASLSLHYFAWPDTVALFQRVRETLAPDGLFLCRLNSTRDVNFGAVGHPEIEANYFSVDGRPKRFFDRAAIDALFASGWRQLSCQETVIARYGRPKVVWEIVAERDDIGIAG